MTRQEHLLVLISEECAEVSQRACKALRFGLQEIQPDQELTNYHRMMYEFADLLSVMDMLHEASTGHVSEDAIHVQIQNKRIQVEKFLLYSKECGTLDD